MNRELNKHLASIGKTGGNATLKKYGSGHFSAMSKTAKDRLGNKGRTAIARKAAQARWKDK